MNGARGEFEVDGHHLRRRQLFKMNGLLLLVLDGTEAVVVPYDDGRRR